MKPTFLSTLAVVFLALQVAKAQTTFTSATNGNWHTGSTWNGGSKPTEWANPKNNVNINHNITGTSGTSINGLNNVTLASGKTFTSTGNLTLSNIINFVSNGGTMTINGDLTLNASSLTLNTGTLIVTGKLTVAYGSTLTIKSGASFTAASMEVTSNNDAIVNLYGNGHVTSGLTLKGTFNVFSGGYLDVDQDVTMSGGAGRFNIAGEVNIDRDLSLSSGPGVGTPMLTVTPTGKLTVGRHFSVSGGTSATIDGTIDVAQNIKLGNPSGGSQINGTGTAIWGGNFQMTNNGSTVNGHDYTDPPSASPFNLGSYSTVLPIKLAAFTVSKSGQDILIKWTTSMEENFEYFSVQRSINGVDFEEIAQIKGKGWSEVLNDYSYTDTAAPAGRLYYRLQSFDFDGYTEIFKVLSIEKSRFAASTFSAYPNPLSGTELTLSEGSVSTESVTINVFDQSGVLVKTLELAPFQNTIDLDLQAGVYILKSTSTGDIFRLIKK